MWIAVVVNSAIMALLLPVVASCFVIFYSTFSGPSEWAGY